MPTLLESRQCLRRSRLARFFQVQLQYTNLRHRRPFSVLTSPKLDQVDIPVGSSGPIKLDIHHPLRPSQSNPTIIYLPLGLGTREEPRALASVATAANATTVRLHYRFSLSHPYPISIHDVLAGYDWVVKHLGTSSAAHNNWQAHSTKSTSVGVCGQLVGGSLAAMLALTECHTSRTGVRAAALCNPITDWTIFHSSTPTKEDTEGASGEGSAKAQYRDSTQQHSITDSSLLGARKDLFITPSHYFDPFASPLLFFRTASSDLPLDHSQHSDASVQSLGSSSSEISAEWIKKRRVQRKHPPLGSGLRLPNFRIDVGEETVVKEHGIELAEAITRSVDLHEEKDGKAVAGVEREIEAQKRVRLRIKKGEAFWTEEDFADVGNWLGRVLR